MVTPGQLLERPVLILAGEVCLDGIYLRGDGPGLLVASPLPGSGGSMTNPVGCELAYAAAYAGAASLRLDYQGVGASEGDQSDVLDALTSDLRAGLTFLVESARGEPSAGAVVAGLYSGAAAALRLAGEDERVSGLLLLCPDYAALQQPPAYADLQVPVVEIQAGDDPLFNMGEVTERVDAARNARLHGDPRGG